MHCFQQGIAVLGGGGQSTVLTAFLLMQMCRISSSNSTFALILLSNLTWLTFNPARLAVSKNNLYVWLARLTIPRKKIESSRMTSKDFTVATSGGTKSGQQTTVGRYVKSRPQTKSSRYMSKMKRVQDKRRSHQPETSGVPLVVWSTH